VKVNALPTSTISGSVSICKGNPTNLSEALTGTPPWSLTYSDGTTPVTITNITSTPYLISVSPTSSTPYIITNLNDANCNATVANMKGSAVVKVIGHPSSVISGTTTICIGGSANLSVTLKEQHHGT